jgi:hypothetical protein
MPLPLPIQFEFRKPNAPLGLLGQMSKLWTPKELIFDIKALRELAYRQKFKGPFILVLSTSWEPILDLQIHGSAHLLRGNMSRRIGDVVNLLPGIKALMTSHQLPEFHGILYEA